MKKYLFYLMQGEEMCALHALMNAADLAKENEVKIIFEGKAVNLPSKFSEAGNPLYKKLVDQGVTAGVCKACSEMFKVLDKNRELGLPILEDMNGHAGMKPYADEGYDIIVF